MSSYAWHTMTIDEGHRLKADSTRLATALARISTPFRLLLVCTCFHFSQRKHAREGFACRCVLLFDEAVYSDPSGEVHSRPNHMP